MNYYCDITLLPNPETPATILMSTVFSKLHHVLVNTPNSKVGVSFPKVSKTLGNVLRLHASEDELNDVLKANWLKGLHDYCNVSECKPVPTNCSYRFVKRLQKKSTYNKRKRAVAKGWLTQEEAVKKIPDEKGQRLLQPYVQIKSSSTGQQVKLFIEHSVTTKEPVLGEFSRYGLSSTATIPWF